MPDGTVKQINPFTGTEVWAVSGRGNKPLANNHEVPTSPIQKKENEDYCSFCKSRYFDVPPEKARLVNNNGHYETLYHVMPNHYGDTTAEFRRTGNLFEIVTIDYWKKNYDYKLNTDLINWRDSYINRPEGSQHIDDIIHYKLVQSGRTTEEIHKKEAFDKLRMLDAFFGGCHELIIAKSHYIDTAENDSQLRSSGELTLDEHYHYLRFTIDSMHDMLGYNRYIRYISVFQNWLRPAGASFDHLHKQICGLDEWGSSISEQIQMVRQEPNVFNELGVNLAAQYNLVFGENDTAVAFIGIGHRFPTIEIYSKSFFSRPHEHSDEEIRGMSNLVHACHAALGSKLSCNEEWYYTPIDAVYKMPWHILLKLRMNVPAGFEGGTGIFINPMTPVNLRDSIVPKLFQMRAAGTIASMSIAEECAVRPNPLQYYMK